MTKQLTQRGLARRRELLDFATVRFAENGYHPTSVAEIVQGIGVGKGVFYWYFESKEQLLLEILKDAQHDLRRVQHLAIADEPDPVRRIELGIRASLAWSAAHRDVNNLIQFAATDGRFLPALQRGQETAVADVMRHLDDGIARGLIRDVDPRMLAHAILGATSQMSRVFIHEQGLAADVVADNAVAFVLDGLLVRDSAVAAR